MNPFTVIDNPFITSAPMPSIVEIDLSNSCNQNCKWCKDKSFRDELPHNIPVDIIHKLSQVLSGRVKKIIVTGGGEPTVHPKFEQILRKLKETGAEITLVTNGELLESYIRVVKETCNDIIISLDANSFQTYSKLHRGEKFSHMKVLNGLKALSKQKDRKYRVSVSFLVNAYNYFELPAFIQSMAILKVDRIIIEPLFIRGFELTDKIKIYTLAVVEQNELPIRIEYNLEACSGSCKKCYACDFLCIIGADAKAYSCPGLRGKSFMILGDLKQMGFEDIWTGERRKKVLEHLNTERCPQNCKYIRYNNAINLIFEEGVK